MKVLSLEETRRVSGATLPAATATAMQNLAALFNTTLGTMWAATAAPAGVAEFSTAARVAALVASQPGTIVVGTFLSAYAVGTVLNDLTGSSEMLAEFAWTMLHDPADEAPIYGNGGGTEDGSGSGFYYGGQPGWENNDPIGGGYWDDIPPGYEEYF